MATTVARCAMALDCARHGVTHHGWRGVEKDHGLAGGPAGCFSHTGGCSALHAMDAMRQVVPVFTKVNTSAPQWDHALLT